VLEISSGAISLQLCMFKLSWFAFLFGYSVVTFLELNLGGSLLFTLLSYFLFDCREASMAHASEK